MKKYFILLIAICIACNTGMASASSMSYTPESISLSIPAGSSEQALVRVGVVNAVDSTYWLWVINKIVDGNLPAAWVTATPGKLFTYGGASVSSVVKISVPAGTPAGLYSGHIQSWARATKGDLALAGNGIRLNVMVPSQCSGVPVITVDSVVPKTIWPPDHSLTQVVLSGTVQVPDGCVLGEAGYAIEDEYSLLSGVFKMDVAASGSFSVVVPVEAMRRGQDKDGRHYLVTFFARNEVGSGSSPSQVIVVPHDQSQQD